VFGFAARKEERSLESRVEAKASEQSGDGGGASVARVQFLAESELELDVLLSERRLEGFVFYFYFYFCCIIGFVIFKTNCVFFHLLITKKNKLAAVALLEQAQGPLEALRRRLLSERESANNKNAHLTLSRIESRISQVAAALTVQLTSPAISVTEARVVVGLLK
jgi:hypothetical protein